MASGEFKEPPGSALAAFAATQFVVLLSMVQIANQSIFTKLALVASSIAMPFLLICWVTVRDLEIDRQMLCSSL